MSKPHTARKGSQYEVTVPSAMDRLVQAALVLVLEPVFEADFLPVSYGFRPMRRANDAVGEVQRYGTKGYRWVLDADIEACFDTISHPALMDRVRARVKDKRVLALVKAFLKAGILTELGERHAAAKMGIVGLTYSCANALRRYGVTANVISPLAMTRMTASIPEERRREIRDADERLPGNVAPAVAYVASEASDWLTDQIIAAGGYRIGLYNRPQVVSQIVSDGPFGIDQAATTMELAFRPIVGQ
jgi:hypothetical protein